MNGALTEARRLVAIALDGTEQVASDGPLDLVQAQVDMFDVVKRLREALPPDPGDLCEATTMLAILAASLAHGLSALYGEMTPHRFSAEDLVARILQGAP